MIQVPTVQKNLIEYLDSGFPILYICTYDESKVDHYISACAGEKEIIEWNRANGLVDFNTKKPQINPDYSLENALLLLNDNNRELLKKKLVIIKDAEEQLKSEKIVAMLKDIAREIRTNEVDTTIVIVSPVLYIPQPLEKSVAILDLDLPEEKTIRGLIGEFVKLNDAIPSVSDALMHEMAVAFKGLYEFEITDLLNLAAAKDGELTRKTLKYISDQKKQIILKSGLLEMIDVKEKIDDIGGLENLKDWLKNKAKVFQNLIEAEKFGVPMPKGVLIAGVAGCGKSLTAKAAGSLFDVPLLRLDMGRLMGKYVGESEENMRKAIKLAEAISPCVLWVDELEKAFAGIGSGGGAEVTTRLFGAFLTWMQEKTKAVFVVATANDITKLPPELLRKGRFDEIFYVTLPNGEEREKIFSIHISKRRKSDAAGIDIKKLADNTAGYSGADIESVVGESTESVFVNGGSRLTTEDIISCIKNTSSLYEIMGSQIDDLKRSYEKNKFKKASR